MINKLKFLFALVIVNCILLISCVPKTSGAENVILLGTIAGPETELVEIAKTVAKDKFGLDIHIVPFNDYVEPNRALVEGEINANMFQHQQYLDEAIHRQNLKLVNVGKLFFYPMGIYSDRHKKLSDIPESAVVAVPNDISNQARSLLLLQKAGLITLNINGGTSSIKDIATNPKNIKFEEVDPAFMVRMLSDVDFAVINTNYAAMARLLPNRDALYTEEKDSVYANILVVRAEDQDKKIFKLLLESIRSPEVIKKAEQLFNKQAVVAW